MAEKNGQSVNINEIFEDGTAIDEALRQSAQDARRLHKALGQPIAEWRNGKVVWIEPEDIVIYDTDSRDESASPDHP